MLFCGYVHGIAATWFCFPCIFAFTIMAHDRGNGETGYFDSFLEGKSLAISGKSRLEFGQIGIVSWWFIIYTFSTFHLQLKIFIFWSPLLGISGISRWDEGWRQPCSEVGTQHKLSTNLVVETTQKHVRVVIEKNGPSKWYQHFSIFSEVNPRSLTNRPEKI